MIYAANFKMHHTRTSTKTYIEALQETLAGKDADDRVIVFPPSTAYDHYEGDFTLGAQNAYPAKEGAYTGEIGIAQLEEFGIRTILIGHSERRQMLGETQSFVAEKFAYFKENGFEILYCVGEPLHIRQQGDEVVMTYLLSQFEGIDTSYEKLIVAYEPIWAIGTGCSATIEEIATTHEGLKKTIQKPLLYGGSVKPENIKEIASIRGVDGVLVGSASLQAESFSKLILHDK